MSEQRIKFRNLSDVVEDLTHEVNDPGGTYSFMKLLRGTVAAMQELNLWVLPNLYTQRFSVGANGAVDMPADCAQPVKAFLAGSAGDQEILFQLAKEEKNYPRNVTCEVLPASPTLSETVQTTLPNYFGEDKLAWNYYGEAYGNRKTRFWGSFSYEAAENRTHFPGLSEGDVVIIIFKSLTDDYKKIPLDAVPVLKYLTLSRYYIPSDKGAADRYMDQFKRAMRMFKKGRLSGLSYEDYIDAITGQFSSAVGP